MKKEVRQEVKALIKEMDLNCSVEKFQEKVDFLFIIQTKME